MFKHRKKRRSRRRTVVSRNALAHSFGKAVPGRARQGAPGLLRKLFLLLASFAAGAFAWTRAPEAWHWAVTAARAPWEKTLREIPAKPMSAPLVRDRRPVGLLAGNKVLGVDSQGVVFPLKRGAFLDLPFLSTGENGWRAGDTVVHAGFALRVLSALARRPSPLFAGISDVAPSGENGAEMAFGKSGRRVRMSGNDVELSLDQLCRVLAQPGLFVKGTLYLGYKKVAFVTQEEG